MALTNQLDKTKIGLILKRENCREGEKRRRKEEEEEEEEKKKRRRGKQSQKGMELTLGMNSSMDTCLLYGNYEFYHDFGTRITWVWIARVSFGH